MAVILPASGETPWGTKLNTAINGIDTRLGTVEAARGDLYNFGNGNTRVLQRGMGKALAGTGYCDHLIIGDSLSCAYTGAAFDYPGSWWRRMKTLLTTQGYPSGGSGIVSIADANSGMDPRYGFTGTWGNNTSYVSSGSAGTATFTSTDAGTAVDVFYPGASAAFTVKIDGGSAVAVTPPGSGGAVYTVTGLSNAVHTVVVTTTGANVFLFGMQVRQTSGVRFHNMAVKYGQSASGFYADTGPVAVRTIAQVVQTTADVLHISLGLNDIAGSVTAAATVTAIENIAALWPSADVILYLGAGLDQLPTTWPPFVTALYAAADSHNWPLVDLNRRWGTGMLAKGLIGADALHLNATGQADWAGVALQAMNAAIR